MARLNKGDVRVAVAVMRHQLGAIEQAMIAMNTMLVKLEESLKPSKPADGKS